MKVKLRGLSLMVWLRECLHMTWKYNIEGILTFCLTRTDGGLSSSLESFSNMQIRG